MFHFGIIDWLIVIVPIVFICYLAVHSRLFVKDAVDYLAAGRVANRYVLSAGDLSSGLAVFTLVALVEERYVSGTAVGFWGTLGAPLGIIMSLYGFVAYRWREVKCLSKGQFLELRYGSRAFRVATSVVSTMSEMMINALYPAITANFLIYYFGIPHHFMLFGYSIPTFSVIVTGCLALAVLMIWPAGRVSLLITDAIQGVFSYPIFAAISIFVLFKLDFDQDIAVTLGDRVAGQSFLNPYDVQQFRDFNLFAVIVNLVNGVLNRGSWYGNDTSNSAKTPHEQKMAGLLGSFRNGFAWTMMTLLAILVYCFMNGSTFNSKGGRNPFPFTSDELRLEFSEQILGEVVPDTLSPSAAEDLGVDDEPGSGVILRKKVMAALREIPPMEHTPGVDAPFSQTEHPDVRYWDKAKEVFGDSPQGRLYAQRYKSVYSQMRSPAVFSRVFPVGLTGAFILLMIMLMVSTDDSRIFNAVGCIIQDIVLPFSKGEVTPKRHIRWLHIGTIGVTIFFFIVGVFFSQIDYVQMVNMILMSIWLGGAGPIILGGLYTRFGNIHGAWGSLIFGSGISTTCCILQQTWTKSVCPWIESHPGWYEKCDHFLRAVSAPLNPLVRWEMRTDKFPINSYEILALSMLAACTAYVVGSYLHYKPFDLDKFLHRGKYAPPEKIAEIAAAKAARAQKSPLRRFLDAMVSITPEYTRGDRVLAWAMFCYSFVWSFVLWWLVPVIWNNIHAWSPKAWIQYFYISNFPIAITIGSISTIWFGIGCSWGIVQLFKDLKKRKESDTSADYDYGRVTKEMKQ